MIGRFSIVLTVMAAMCAGSVYASEKKGSEATATHAESAEKKPARKKKVQICNECGKPEPECECGHAKGGDKGKSETGHSSDDGHKH